MSIVSSILPTFALLRFVADKLRSQTIHLTPVYSPILTAKIAGFENCHNLVPYGAFGYLSKCKVEKVFVTGILYLIVINTDWVSKLIERDRRAKVCDVKQKVMKMYRKPRKLADLFSTMQSQKWSLFL